MTITKDIARSNRDRLRTVMAAIKAAHVAINDIQYDRGNYREDVTPYERAMLSYISGHLFSDEVLLGRADRAFNDIISYRPEAKIDPANWEAVERQEYKADDAAQAQVMLAQSDIRISIRELREIVGGAA